MGMGSLSKGDKNVLRWNVVMVVQLCGYTKVMY